MKTKKIVPRIVLDIKDENGKRVKVTKEHIQYLSTLNIPKDKHVIVNINEHSFENVELINKSLIRDGLRKNRGGKSMQFSSNSSEDDKKIKGINAGDISYNEDKIYKNIWIVFLVSTFIAVCIYLSSIGFTLL